MRSHPIRSTAVLITCSASSTARAADEPPLKGVRRVVFLGDSITYSGGYVEYLEAYLRLH